MKEIVWHTPESSDGERTLKQHAFTSYKRGKWWEELYMGNKMLCNKGGMLDEKLKYASISEIHSEELNPEKACKKCLKIANI